MSGLMGGGKTQGTTPKRLNAIQLQQSAYGTAVALVYGKTRVPGTLIWYGSFKAKPVKQSSGGKGGGGKTVTGYQYSAALAISIADGPITGIGTVWADDTVTTVTALGMTVFTGTAGQATWSYLTTNFSAQAIPYNRIAYVADSFYDLGDAAALPNLTFEVKGISSDATVSDDAEPYNILNDYCTDSEHGCNFPFLATMTGSNSYQQYCKAMGFVLSPAEQTQRPANEFISYILRITNSEAVWSGTTLRIIPYADGFVSGNGAFFSPSLTPLFAFTDDDYTPRSGEDPVICKRKPPSEVFNRVRVEYLDRANQYNTAIAEATDAADIALNGERPMDTVSFHAITQTSVARTVAQLILQRQMYYRNQYTFHVRADYCLLEPMDVVTITDSNLGLNAELVRVIAIDDGEDDTVSLTVEELPVGPAGSAVYNWAGAQGYSQDTSVAPGSVLQPVIFAAPPELVSSTGGYEMWIAVTGPNNNYWGGCNVLVSTDNVNYALAGTLTNASRYGTLTATFPTGTETDTANTLSVVLSNTSLTLTAGSTTDADNMRTLLWVDGEIVSYSYCTLTGTGAYTFTSTGISTGTKYMRRGKYSSTIASHASGTYWVRLDGNLFRLPLDAGMQGQTLYFKFQSFNIWGKGVQDVSTLTAYTKTIPSIKGGVDPSRTDQMIARGNMAPVILTAPFTYASATTGITVSWASFSILRADGTTTTITDGSHSVTGLTSNTLYYFYPYYDEVANDGVMKFVTGGVGSTGTMFTARSTVAAQSQYLLGRVALNSGGVLVSTTASGTGGGSGGGGACLHPDQWVDTKRGRIRASALHVGDEVMTPTGWGAIEMLKGRWISRWIAFGFSNDARATVTETHRFLKPDGTEVSASDVRLGDILAGAKEHMEVMSMRLLHKRAICVSAELGNPHLYYITSDGPLSHNPKP